MDDMTRKLIILKELIRPTYISLIKTPDPEYLPASSSQVGELKDLVVKLTKRLESVISAGAPSLLAQVTPICLPTPKRYSDIDHELVYKFRRLASQWKNETRFASTVVEMAIHPAYQQIIGMGNSAIPLILQELASEPDHWFWALKAITGEDPVPENTRGKLLEMAAAWLKWGQDQGYEYE